MEETTIELTDLVSQDSGLAYELMLVQAKCEQLQKENAQIIYELMTSKGGS
ncbi:hypothetical protein [Bacillus atrophaeus]|uniref:hypothetical protein n=1 Tax=Bacillus atrophaeus TaxID=1452 RepID=UPI00255B869A|nr:hypothetical protein [Bacillus atrophaeus]MDL5141135.1 hypothetical protein [Bacillus atrophaeus]